MKQVYVFLLFLLAPVLALVILSQSIAEEVPYDNNLLREYPIAYHDVVQLDESIHDITVDLRSLSIKASDMQISMDQYVNVFSLYSEAIRDSIEDSKGQKHLSDDIYEQRITNALGEPIDFYLSNKTEIKIFELKELGYRGFIAKVKLFDPYVFKMSLADNKIGGLETTSDAAIRTGAVLAINGGGFGSGPVGDEMVSTMIGGTVVNGELVNDFIRKINEDLFFVGIDKYGNLVGGIPETSEDIMAMKPYQGASFIPILIQNGEKITLPSAWKNTKHPRTIIGQYANDDLILIVVDGRQGDWSVGITLERLQDKLLELGVKDAYNLDGGGSTAMYFKGQILNKPSDGKERPVANHFIIVP
ncbi:MAG: phosphodiester glycosidase family protein [Clostridia bacterium]|nr:phosphodiester glycosidase family protein [Clostridia bacterium]